ncbi:DNA-binding protein [Ornithobacterium rhinotracheale]|uniref:helix-turn-helix domain-containing protein n=1 Tax=Ornithobacterium rhinotracheale TaxID=28251 RepID=UPI00129CA36D|nr:helix-turn-helix domain-containing protein [Ornithobacterium rhinotracheale]MRJ11254.1 DNA-binding protein [Ornithobacterium rhinotracheale]
MEVIVIEKRAFEQINQKLGDLLKQTKSVVETHQAICQDKKWLDTQEVCQLLGISKRTLQNYKDRNLLPYSYINRKNYYKRSDVLHLLENQTAKTEI